MKLLKVKRYNVSAKAVSWLMKRQTVLLLFLLLTTVVSSIAQQYASIVVEDFAHRRALVAGDSDDNNVYHQNPRIDPDNSESSYRDNAMWEFQPVDGNYYYIIDRRHRQAVVAGDRYDGRVYHQPPNNRENAKWKLVPVSGQEGYFYIIDKKHGRALVAGNNYDGRLYHQEAGGRSNAKWKLDIVEGRGRFLAPKELLISQEVIQIEYFPESRRYVQGGASTPIILSDSEANQTDRDGGSWRVSLSEERTSSDTYTISNSTSHALTLELGASFGFSLLSVSVSASINVSNTWTTESGQEESSTVAKTYTFMVERDIPLPACTKLTYTKRIESQKAIVPFKVHVKRTYGDLRQTVEFVDGEWEGAEFTEGEGNLESEAIAGCGASPCTISNLTAGTPRCTGSTYEVDITVAYTNPPTAATLNVNGQTFPVTQSPQTVTLTNLVADNNPVNVTATLANDCTLTNNALFTAPKRCGDTSGNTGCTISNLSVGEPTCTGTTYEVDVTLIYNNPTASDTLNVNGQIFLVTQSPQTVTLTNLPADGKLVNIIAGLENNCAIIRNGLFLAPQNCETTGGNEDCNTFESDTPVQISNGAGAVYTSVIDVSASGSIEDVNIQLEGTHSYISDLLFELISPDGTTVRLMNEVCDNQYDFDITLDDQAMAVLSCPINAGNTQQPQSPLSAFNGQNASGIWTLRITDQYDEDGGQLTNWSLTVCTGEGNDTVGNEDCADVILICGQSYDGNTASGSNIYSQYNCADWEESGKEIVHKIVTTTTGNITAVLTNVVGGDLDVFILSACDTSACIAVGDEAAIAGNQPPGIYYIIVDGYEGDEGTYTLTVDAACNGAMNPPSTTVNRQIPTTASTILKEAVQIHPNPFQEQTMITYQLDKPSKVDVAVYNTNGEEVAALVNLSEQKEGIHQVAFDAASYPAGVYFVVIRTATGTISKKIVLAE